MKSLFRPRVGGRINRSPAGTFFVFLILIVVSAFMMLPFVYSILQSLKPMEELFAFPPRFFVVNPTLENFRQMFRLSNSLWVPFSRYVFNSVFVAVVGTTLYVFIASMAAYALAAGDFKGKKLINEIIVKALLFSSPVLAVMQYFLIAKAHMLNTYWALMLPVLAAPLGVFLMRQFIVQMVPVAILESARIDGAGVFSIFWRIVMPIVKPAYMTLIMFTFQSLWNTAGSNFIYEESYKVLPTVMGQIASGGIARAGVGAASAVLLMIPPIIVFFFTQNQVLETMATSGIKE